MCGTEGTTLLLHFCCAMSVPRHPPDTIVAQLQYCLFINLLVYLGPGGVDDYNVLVPGCIVVEIVVSARAISFH